MKDIFCVDYRDAVRSMVRKEIKLNYGIKVPKNREKDKHKSFDENHNKSKHFGVPLDRVPSRNVKIDQYFSVPTFLVEAFDYLNDHLGVEGLFRKSGSSSRQKSLRDVLECRGTFLGCDLLHPHDIASLVKQFFRELPNPLLTNHLSSTLLKCLNLSNLIDSHNALLLCVLLLPDEHLRALMYLVDCINEVANHSSESKMSIRNLGIVFAPNLLCVSGKERNCEKTMRETTMVIDFIFQNPDKIGMVPDFIIHKASAMSIDGGISTSSGDELEENSRRMKSLARHISHDKNRDRSKSIKGLFCRGFRSADRNIGKISPKSWLKHSNLQKVSSSLDDVNKMHYISTSSISSNGSAKRHSTEDLQCGPVRKSPRLDHQTAQVPSYSIPMMSKMVNHYTNATSKHLQYEIDLTSDKYGAETPILTSKFNHGRNKSREPSPYIHSKMNTLESEMEIDHTSASRPQSKLSRQTQKPNVKVSRRSSSLDRRRARYQSTTPKMRRRLPKTPLSENTSKSPFQDENLTVSIVFMKSYDIPKDVDSLAYEPSTLFQPKRKLPRWKSDVTGSIDKRQLDDDTDYIVNKERRRTRTKSRDKVRKSYSMVERSVSRVY